MCHHWRCWSGAHLRGVWSFSFSFYPSKHYFCSTSAATLPQETHWFVGLEEAYYRGANLVWQRDRSKHVLWFYVWSIPPIGVPCWLPRWLCGLRGAVDILPASGLPGGLLWCDAAPSSSRTVNFIVLPLVSAQPHGTSFIPTLLSETIRSSSLCRKTDRGRLGYYAYLLQLWFCSHLSVIARDQLEGFASKSKV